MVNKTDRAKTLCTLIIGRFAALTIRRARLRAAYLIWRKPYMVAGKNTFIDSMLQQCGLLNAFDAERYPQINAETLVGANPDVILLSSEPYPFKEEHIAEFKEIAPAAIIKIVDGELFSWYGSRLLLAPEYFSGLAFKPDK